MVDLSQGVFTLSILPNVGTRKLLDVEKAWRTKTIIKMQGNCIAISCHPLTCSTLCTTTRQSQHKNQKHWWPWQRHRLVSPKRWKMPSTTCLTNWNGDTIVTWEKPWRQKSGNWSTSVIRKRFLISWKSERRRTISMQNYWWNLKRSAFCLYWRVATASDCFSWSHGANRTWTRESRIANDQVSRQLSEK